MPSKKVKFSHIGIGKHFVFERAEYIRCYLYQRSDYGMRVSTGKIEVFSLAVEVTRKARRKQCR